MSSLEPVKKDKPVSRTQTTTIKSYSPQPFWTSHIPIHKDNDLVLAMNDVYELEGDAERPARQVKRTVNLHVNKTAIMNIPAFEVLHGVHFRRMLNSGMSEATKTVIPLQKTSARLMELLLRIFDDQIHDSISNKRQAEEMEKLARLPVAELWSFAALMDFHNVDHRDPRVKTWFVLWWQLEATRITEQDNFPPQDPLRGWKTLLWPCLYFDFAPGFRDVTRYLIYHATGHITTHNPSRYKDIKFPERIVHQLNAAKGRLRTLIHDELSKPITAVSATVPTHDPTCGQSDHASMAYLRALTKIKVWPVAKSMRMASVDDIRGRLLRFDTHEITNCSCNFNYPQHVLAVHVALPDYIPGLCLDCIRLGITKEKHMRVECHERAKHKRECAAISVRWDANCRVRHNQPTWYYSTRAKEPSGGLMQL